MFEEGIRQSRVYEEERDDSLVNLLVVVNEEGWGRVY